MYFVKYHWSGAVYWLRMPTIRKSSAMYDVVVPLTSVAVVGKEFFLGIAAFLIVFPIVFLLVLLRR